MSAPTGALDVADGAHVAGWASDPDFDGPIAVHVYVDGAIVRGFAADAHRDDVGDHAFDWRHEPFGAGPHEVRVYAIGVDATGALDGENVLLANAPRMFDVGCVGLTGTPAAWCDGNPDYWVHRQTDTRHVGNPYVRVGVNPSYGGTIFQLYDDDWTRNLVLEHGGGAVQLSLYGYDPVGPDAWFATDTCDGTPWPDEASCRAAGHAGCVARAWSAGAHVADCAVVPSCNGVDAGWPWNPIQAQGTSCTWASPTNDAAVEWLGDSLRTVQNTPGNFSKSDAGVPGLTFEQTVTPGDFWMQIAYTVRYDGPRTWSDHDQEIPAIFTAEGVDAHFYWYGGDAPYTDATSPVAHADGSDTPPFLDAWLGVPGTTAMRPGSPTGVVTERWWSACDDADDRCVTVASFDPRVRQISMLQLGSTGGAYLTPLGSFHLYPGLVETFTLYLFPYRYDDVVDGVRVRDAIFDLAAIEGCAAEIACNGVDEDCTGEDRCGTVDTGAVDTADTTDTTDSTDTTDTPGPCGCAAGSTSGVGFALVAAMLGRRRRGAVGTPRRGTCAPNCTRIAQFVGDVRTCPPN